MDREAFDMSRDLLKAHLHDDQQGRVVVLLANLLRMKTVVTGIPIMYCYVSIMPCKVPFSPLPPTPIYSTTSPLFYCDLCSVWMYTPSFMCVDWCAGRHLLSPARDSD